MKAAFEHVTFGEGCSVRVYHRQLQRIPFEWHHHPEYELTLTLGSAGKRYVEALPQAKLHVVKSCGHCVDMEQPDVLAKLVTEFIGRG